MEIYENFKNEEKKTTTERSLRLEMPFIMEFCIFRELLQSKQFALSASESSHDCGGVLFVPKRQLICFEINLNIIYNVF